MLEVNNIDTFYGASQVLFAMRLDIRAAEVVTLMGRNGMGKTTTVRSIMGLTPATKGSIWLNGAEITTVKSYRIAQMGLGLVPEGRQIFPNLSTQENLIATASKSAAGANNWTLDRVLELFPTLRERRRNMGNLLSGGEQQMLAIGRALMTNPKLLILDEATEGLAPMIRQEIWHCLRGLKDAGQAILIIDKNLKALLELGDRHYIIEKGQVVWHGNSDELRAAEDVQHRHLGV